MSVRSRVRPLLRRSVQRMAYPLIVGLGFVLNSRRRHAHAETPRRILIVRLDLLGDVLFTLPLAAALRQRYPHVHLTMVTLPYTAQLARLDPAVDEVVELDTNRIRTIAGLVSIATWREYRRVYRALHGQYDLAISVYGKMASLVVLLSGARRSIGYRDEAYPHSLTEPVPGGRHQARMHEVEYVRRLARAADAADQFPDRRMIRFDLSLVVPEQARRAMRDRLTSCGIAPEDLVVAIHAGSVNGSAKRWPAAQWAGFADALLQSVSVKIVLVGSASDRAIAHEVERQTQAPLISLVGQTTIAELAALLERADLVASGDSGPLHLAVALQRPLLAVYGPTDPAIYGPYRPTAPVRLHRADLPCSPCYTLAATAECPLGDPICMRLVSVRAMVRDALEVLELSGVEDQLAMTE